MGITADETNQTNIGFVVYINCRPDELYKYVLMLRHKKPPYGGLYAREEGTLVSSRPFREAPTRDELSLWMDQTFTNIPWLSDQIVGHIMLEFGQPFEADPSIIVIESDDTRLYFRPSEFFNEGDHNVQFVCLRRKENGFFFVLGKQRITMDIKWTMQYAASVLRQAWPMSVSTATELVAKLYRELLDRALPSRLGE